MKRKIYQVDAFTNKPYSGNPAGVMVDAQGLSEQQMLLIAKEMKLSETAFVFPGGIDHDFEVRFFTPTEEVDLCGHATIGTFTLLRELGLISKDKKEVIQKTKAGILNIRFLEDGSVLMRQADPICVSEVVSMEALSKAMNIEMDHFGIEGVMTRPEIWSTGLADIMLPMKSIESLKRLSPHMDLLASLSVNLDVTGVHAFALDEENTLWCRNFAPACGIPEESATGTSNGALGACLYSKGWQSVTALSYVAHQGDWMESPSRISVEIKGGSQPEVWVGGQAVTVLEGEITLPN